MSAAKKPAAKSALVALETFAADGRIIRRGGAVRAEKLSAVYYPLPRRGRARSSSSGHVG
jgi:hypothetical protein